MELLKTLAYIVSHPRDVYRLVYSSKIQYPSLYKRLVDDVNTTHSLDMIGKIHSTDKASAMIKDSHFDKMHDYLRHYDVYFSQIRENKINILEFGCQGGNSLRLWEEYFPQGDVYGVDLDEKCKEFETDRTHVVVGNAVSDETYNELSNNPGKFNVIIDDASHAWGEQRFCLEKYWELLEWGGIYIVEDLGCGCYGAYSNKGYTPEIIDQVPFSVYATNIAESLRWISYEQYCEKCLANQFSKEMQAIMSTVDRMTFAHCIIMIHKIDRDLI